MELRLVRSVYTDTSTLGRLFLDGAFYAFTCEDKDRKLKGDIRRKVKAATAIDEGRYEVVCSYSNRFKRYLPLLLNVPCFEGIRIHGGNTHADSEGCILIGAEGDMQSRIWNCASRLANLVAMMKAVERREKIFIEIVKG